MIIAIIILVVFLTGLGLTIYSYIREHRHGDANDTAFAVGIMALIFGGIAFIGSLTHIATVNGSYLVDKIRLEYNTVVEELNADRNYVTMITDDYARSIAAVQYNEKVKEFKAEIQSKQLALNNIWICWYECYEYNNLDPNVVDYIK